MSAIALLATAAVLAAAVLLLWKMSVQLQAMAERVGRLDEVTRDVQRVGQSISGLEQILASPKLRGSLGEWTLGYELLGLITYFTVGPKEARAWTITKGTKAPGAAGVIHGFHPPGTASVPAG